MREPGCDIVKPGTIAKIDAIEMDPWHPTVTALDVASVINTAETGDQRKPLEPF